MIDVHAHLFHPAFDDDQEDVINEAEDHGVTTILNNGLNAATNQDCHALKDEHSLCEAAAGIHPEQLREANGDELTTIYEQMRDDTYAAIGEVGLDYRYADMDEDRERQRRVFKHVLNVAKDTRKPVIIHSRGAEDDVLRILREERAQRVILHSFTGRRHQWRTALKHGYHLSIPSNIEASTHFQSVVSDADTHAVLTETDAPFLSRRGEQRSLPHHVQTTLDYLEDLHGAPVDGVIAETYNRLFHAA